MENSTLIKLTKYHFSVWSRGEYASPTELSVYRHIYRYIWLWALGISSSTKEHFKTLLWVNHYCHDLLIFWRISNIIFAKVIEAILFYWISGRNFWLVLKGGIMGMYWRYSYCLSDLSFSFMKNQWAAGLHGNGVLNIISTPIQAAQHLEINSLLKID